MAKESREPRLPPIPATDPIDDEPLEIIFVEDLESGDTEHRDATEQPPAVPDSMPEV